MTEKPKAVNLIATCPHCGETIELTVTKKQIKEIFKGFKLPIREAQLQAEQRGFSA